ncbi:hypothetical protein [Planomicrobium sp. YIM 101495]|uniref:hypothetical protein n=1 Tax=Planomicrobium sp. YIM 101495 TaxID=2665160 RepID=UPI0012BA1F90|nr:hypothetical protein [Planomicrobium sp. YIM 101495]MTD29572.1 hypothetical protein [Planomicrobium sp. YIM 101495]
MKVLLYIVVFSMIGFIILQELGIMLGAICGILMAFGYSNERRLNLLEKRMEEMRHARDVE